MIRAILSLFCLLAFVPIPARSATTADAILARLDQFNQKMKTFQCSVVQKKFIRILGEFDDPEPGELYMKKAPSGILLKKVMGKPGHTFLSVRANDVVLYYPKKNQAIRRRLTQKETGFANLGVAMSSVEMKKNFEIRYLRDEVLEGRNSNLIQLIPRSAEMKANFSSLYLWLSVEDGTPLQQRIDEVGGDYTVIQFNNIQLNLNLKDAVFELKLPRNVEFIS